MLKGQKTLIMALPFLLLLGTLFIPCALAPPEAGIIKEYNPFTKTVTIKENLAPVAEFQLLENTDQCLIDCYAKIRINADRDPTLDWMFSLPPKEYTITQLIPVTHNRTGYKCNPYEICNEIANKSKECISYSNCTEYTYLETLDEEVAFDYKSLKPADYSKDLIIYLHGKKNPTESIEWIPEYYGMQLKEFAWWNSGWDRCRNITINNSATVNRTFEPIIINLTGLTNKQADSDDVRIIDAECNNDGNEIIYGLIDNTSTSTYVVFSVNIDPNKNKTYSVYYNNTAATKPSYTSDLILKDGETAGRWVENSKYTMKSIRNSSTAPPYSAYGQAYSKAFSNSTSIGEYFDSVRKGVNPGDCTTTLKHNSSVMVQLETTCTGITVITRMFYNYSFVYMNYNLTPTNLNVSPHILFKPGGQGGTDATSRVAWNDNTNNVHIQDNFPGTDGWWRIMTTNNTKGWITYYDTGYNQTIGVTAWRWGVDKFRDPTSEPYISYQFPSADGMYLEPYGNCTGSGCSAGSAQGINITFWMGSYHIDSGETIFSKARNLSTALDTPLNWSYGTEETYLSSQDTTPPVIEFQAPTPNNETVDITWAFINVTANENLTNASVEWDGTNYTMQNTNETNWYRNMTSLSDGNYSFKVWGNDTRNNNGTSETRHVSISYAAPSGTIIFVAPTDNNITINRNFTFINVTLSAAAADTNYTIDTLSTGAVDTNLTFRANDIASGDAEETINIKIPKNANVTTATLVLSPYETGYLKAEALGDFTNPTNAYDGQPDFPGTGTTYAERTGLVCDNGWHTLFDKINITNVHNISGASNNGYFRIKYAYKTSSDATVQLKNHVGEIYLSDTTSANVIEHANITATNDNICTFGCGKNPIDYTGTWSYKCTAGTFDYYLYDVYVRVVVLENQSDYKYNVSDVHVDTADNGHWDWNFTGNLTQQTADLNTSAINDYLFNCTADSGNNCTFSVIINSSITGKAEVTSINLTYWLPPSLEWNGVNESMIRSNSTSYYKNKTDLSDSNYTFRVHGTITGSETVSETRWVYVDTTLPAIAFVNPTPNNATTTHNWTYINVTAIDNLANDAAQLEWNGTNESMTRGNSTVFHINKTGLVNGNFTFRVWINDTMNNQNVSETRWIRINKDLTPPTVDFQLPTPNNETLPYGVDWAYIDIISTNNLTNATLTWNGVNESMILHGYENITQENWSEYMVVGTHAIYAVSEGFIVPVTTSVNISQVSLSIREIGNPANNTWVEIRADAGGIPTNTSIAVSDNISSSAINSGVGSWYNYTFSSPVNITGNTLYHMVWKHNMIPTSPAHYAIAQVDSGTHSMDDLYIPSNTTLINSTNHSSQFGCSSGNSCDLAFNITFQNNRTRWYVNKTSLGGGNYTFMAWGVNSTGHNITSEIRWVYIDYVNITLCGDETNTSVLVFRYYDEEDVTARLNASMNINIISWTVTGGATKNTSFSFGKAENHTVCIYPVNASIYANVSLDYQNNDTHPIRNYYLRSATLSNQTYNFSLYLLETALADLVKYTIIDYANEPVDKALMKIQRFVHADNAYITIAMIETDSEGVGLVWLRGNDIFYKYIIEKEGTLLADLAPSKIMIDPTTDQAELTITADPTTLGAMYDYISDVSYGCSLNTTTNVLRCVLTDSTGMTQTIRLVVEKIEPLLTTNICDNTVSNTAATMTCDIGTSANGTYSYRFYALLDDGGTYMLDGGLLEFTPANIYGAMGVFFAFLIFITMMGIGIYDPRISLAFGGGAILVSTALEFLAIELGLVTGLLAVLAIIIYKMK